MSAPTLTTIKRLFALSGNRCTFPGCDSPLVEESGTVTGEICHIYAASNGGPRPNKFLTELKRHEAANLILLCSRHHKVVDSEEEKYTPQLLQEFKRKHEESGLVEISPSTARAAKAILDDYLSVTINSNSGQIAIQSPGAVQANTINFKTIKSKVTFSPPTGSIGEDRACLAYTKYLIDRYQQYQLADSSKAGRYKYIAIYNAIKRQFKSEWKLISQTQFEELVLFLQSRIDNTKQGRINKAKQVRNYHSFEEHP